MLPAGEVVSMPTSLERVESEGFDMDWRRRSELRPLYSDGIGGHVVVFEMKSCRRSCPHHWKGDGEWVQSGPSSVSAC